MTIISIGRNSDNMIVIPDATSKVSGSHGQIKIFANGTISYADFSTNGTLVNNTLVHNSEIVVQRGTSIVFPNQVHLNWNEVPDISSIPNIWKQVSIGKNPDNEIHVFDDKISRYHAVLKITKDGKYFLYDQSLNGTSVNGTSIPKFKDYELKRGTKVLFANSQLLDWKQVPKVPVKPSVYILPLLLVFILIGSYFGYDLYFKPKLNLSDKYNSTIGLVYTSYYLVWLNGEDTVYYIGDNGFIDYRTEKYRISELNPFEITGSGFFVSEDGKIVTTKHGTMPWESELGIDKAYINDILGRYNILVDRKFNSNPRTSGVINRIGFFPNNSRIDKKDPLKNMIDCDLIRIASEKEVDLALIQTRNKSLPENAQFVHSEDINDINDLKTHDEVTIIGYPFGSTLGLRNTQDTLKETSTHGRISQLTNKFEVQYDATSMSGASGAPVFNKAGKLVAVNYAGMETKSGFTFGIIAVHVKRLME